MENLSYRDAHAFAFGYLSAEVKDTIAKLQKPDCDRAALVRRLTEAMTYLETGIEKAKGR